MGTAVAIMPSQTISTAVTQNMYAIARWQMHSKSFAGKSVCVTKLSTNTSVTKFSFHCLLCCTVLVFSPWYWQQCHANTHAFETSIKIKTHWWWKAQEQQNTQESHQNLHFTLQTACTLVSTQWLVKTNWKPCHYFTCVLSSNLSVHEFELQNSSTC